MVVIKTKTGATLIKKYEPDGSITQKELYLPRNGDYIIINRDKEVGHPTFPMESVVTTIEHHWERDIPEVVIFCRQL